MPNFRQIIHLWSSRKIKPKSIHIDSLVSQIENGTPITFSRFGDGEWSAIIGKDGENCDGHSYSKELHKALKSVVLSSPQYNVGMQYFALKNMGREIAQFIKEYNIELDWWYADIFHDANLRGELFPFINLLRNSNVVIVGPGYLKELSIFSYNDFIEVPSKNCFDDYERLINEIKEVVTTSNEKTIFLFSASMASNVMIDELYREYGMKHSFLDVGALWDIYVGKKSRGVYNQDHWKETIKKNLGELS